MTECVDSMAVHFQRRVKKRNISGSYTILKSRPVKKPERIVFEGQEELVALLEKIRASDEAALGAFYDATVNRVYGLALRVTTRPELAEEIVSDVYLQVWRKVRSYDSGRASPLGWLMMMCRSRAIDTLRREATATSGQVQQDENRTEIKDDKAVTPLQDLTSRELSGQMLVALQQLNESQRQMIALAFYRGMSHQEVANYTNQPLGTVKSTLRRAQETLRSALTGTALESEVRYGETS
ncbi:MAG TPA: sigma-70 family RNA polymerase sigma factor [Chromatiales bacterium]|nr:sigma-70 family RNA polymerase sigma factor [Thiotrichales bacterium]HIP67732.1 sigma-70 family RNA polymerase sigma factor [Chromatiales bacterium]